MTKIIEALSPFAGMQGENCSVLTAERQQTAHTIDDPAGEHRVLAHANGVQPFATNGSLHAPLRPCLLRICCCRIATKPIIGAAGGTKQLIGPLC